jgi:4-diphosphocytidyl-2-C-methyl-D-erythritol kinase
MTTLVAPAKVNLYLAISPARPDGLHPLTSVFCALELGDEVTVLPADALSLVCEPDLGIAAHENLAWRAAVAMGETFDRSPDFAIRVVKSVPAGAGLAGGSADASAVIAAIAAAWGIRHSDAGLQTVAASLGADVPFSLTGGCGVYTGLGGTLQRALRLPSCHFAIVCGPDPVPTGAAYQAFDSLGRTGAPGPRHVTDAIQMSDTAGLGAALFNNMTDASVGLVPLIAEQLDFMRATPGCLGALMCGSGAAVFGVFATEDEAAAAAASGIERGWWAVHTRPRATGTMEQAMGPDPDIAPVKIRRPHRS